MSNEESVTAVLAEGEVILPLEAVAEEARELAQDFINNGDIQVPKPNHALVADDNNVIGSPATKKKGGTKPGSAKTLDNGAIGSKVADKESKNAKLAKNSNKPSDKVAIFSTRSVSWDTVGSIKKGYNIVSPEASEKWLKRSHVRIATAEEIAREYGS